MLLNSYHKIPTWLFFRRQIPIAIGISLIGFLGVGPVAHFGLTPKNGKSSSLNFYLNLERDRELEPEVCKFHLLENEVQRQTCEEFQNQMTESIILAFLPLWAVLIYFWAAFLILRNFYRKPLDQIDSGRAIEKGILTDPPHLPEDFFGWYFCLQAVSVQLRDGRQRKIYLPVEATRPRAGQALDVVYVSELFGEKRRLGLLSTPHVAIMRGR